MNSDALREVLREISLVAAAESDAQVSKTKVFLACNLGLGNVVYILVPTSGWASVMRYDWHSWLARCEANELAGIDLILCLPVKGQHLKGSLLNYYVNEGYSLEAALPAQSIAVLDVYDIPADLELKDLPLWVSVQGESQLPATQKTPFAESVIELVAHDLDIPVGDVGAVVDVLPPVWEGTVGDLVGAVKAVLL